MNVDVLGMAWQGLLPNSQGRLTSISTGGQHSAHATQGCWKTKTGCAATTQLLASCPQPVLTYQELSLLAPVCLLCAVQALMGPSGAGKSTLMDILAQRKSVGNLSGFLLVNGEPATSGFVRKTAYVPQVILVLRVE